jgi:hypothetical protein
VKNNRITNELENIAQRGVPENTNLWPKVAAQLEGNPPMLIPRTRPVMAILLTIFILLLITGAAYALGRTLGYIPSIGLVDNTSGIRVLAEPVAVTRDGATLTISSVFVYNDRLELVYDVKGIAPENDGTQASDTNTTPTAFCGGVNIGDARNKDGEARLQLPDGTVLERDFTGKYPQNAFAMKPVYAATIPASVTRMTLLLDCIPWARRGAVPEHWSVPFELKSVPAGTVVGAPVIEVQATSAPVATETAVVAPVSPEVASSPKVTFTLERVAQTTGGPIFYIRLHVENPDPAMVTVFPRDVYVIDSQGQKIQYINNTPYSEDPATVWEYIPAAKPAAGPLTLVLNDAVLKFAPQGQATFSFDAGQNPQYNQTWTLNKEFDIAGYKVTVISARAAIFDDIKDNPEIWDPNGSPDYPEGSQGFDNGYQFSIKPGESVSNLKLDILYDSCGLTDIRPSTPAPNLYYTQLCRDGYPKGNVNVGLSSLSVLVKNVGEVSWSPDGTVAPVLPKPHVTLKLEKIVPLDSSIVIYFSMDMENKDPSLVSIMPLTAYVIDSQGQKIQLRGNYVWQPFEHRVGSEFEFTTQSKPAAGPLTVVVEKAVAYYAPLHVDPPQAKPSELEFTFDAGEHPQPGQTWALNNTFEIAGYPLRVTSARATTYNEVKSTNPDFNFDSQGYEYGYDFIVETDPSVKILVEMAIISESPVCWLNNTVSFTPDRSSIHYIQLCRDRYPTGNVKVQIWQLTVLMEDTWQAIWKP